MRVPSRTVPLILLILFCVAVVTWHTLLTSGSRVMRVSFLDVGQGDAIFIESPSGHQVLIDGGPDRSVLRELGEIMPWWDRSIDVVLATHPDADHVSGLVDVLQRFQVDYIVESGAIHDTPQAESLLKSIASEGAQHLLARRGHVLHIGDGAYVEILFPDRDVSALDTNMASIVARVVYGDTSFILTGDAPSAIEEYLVTLDGAALSSNVLKAGHHGSRTSSSLLFVGYVSPEYTVISRGCDNTYGHPHQEVLDTFARMQVATLDTCMDRRITFESDGSSVRRR